MQRNVLLGVLIVLAVIVVGLVLKESENVTPFQEELSSSGESVRKQEDITIAYQENLRKSNQLNSTKSMIRHKEKNRQIDPTIKYVGIDHYGRYIIKLIDTNPEDKDIQLTSNNSVSLEGRINGKQFSMRVPREIVDSPNLKLKIIDRKTKLTKIIPAVFLSDLAGLSSDEVLFVDIDLSYPESIKVDLKTFEEEKTALPPG